MSEPMTLQVCLDMLNDLAIECEADMVTNVMLQPEGGAVVTLYWDMDDYPLEAHLLFGIGKVKEGAARDELQGAFVFDPERFIWSLEEGLSDEQATDYSRRLVEDMDNLVAYLTGDDYIYLQAKPENT